MVIAQTNGLFVDWVWPILEFLIGVGLVVFVHELGHFLAAKAVDIKVEKFAMGIGPKLWGFKRGETEYCLNLLLPLGGYLKMLGQDDVRPAPEPGKGAEAASGAPAAAAQAGALAPAPGEDDPVRSPRAFQNKSVGARMLVISGGVVMNVILGAVLFLIVGLVGKPFGSPVIGGVVAGSPAAQAQIDWQMTPTTLPATSPAFPDANVGLRAGDQIVRIDGDCFLMKLLANDIETFEKVRMIAMLANDSDRYRLTFHREEGNRVLVGVAHMGVRVTTSDVGTSRRGFGIIGALDTVVAKADIKTAGPLRAGDRVVSIAGRKIAHEWDIAPVAAGLDGNAVDIGVLRDGNEVHFLLQPSLRFAPDLGVYFDPNDGSRMEGAPAFLQDANLIAVRWADGNVREMPKTAVVGGSMKEPLDILGMIPRMVVEAVITDSPADKAGVEPGDILYEYGDVRTPTEEQLHQISDRTANGVTNLVVLRGDKSVGPLPVRPKARPGGAELGFPVGADIAHPVVGAVREGSPAARAGLQRGDLIEQVGGQPVQSWIDVFRKVKESQGRPLLVEVKRGENTIEANLGEVTRRFFDPSDYELTPLGVGVVFDLLTVKVIKSNPATAMGWGLNQTWEFVLTSYATLRQLIVGTVSGKEAAGPVGVGQMAVLSARKGLIWLVYLMGIISASVAVVNFLPFPVLDGGHAAMLVLEKIRGKPLPAKVMWVMQLFGLACILVLFVLLTWNDIARILHGS